MPVDDQIDMCERWYRARGLPAIFRLTTEADPQVDARLAARNYERSAGAVVMTRPMRGFSKSADAAARPELSPTPGNPWLDLMAREPGRGGPMRDVLRRMFTGLEAPARFGAMHAPDGTAIAIGLGAVAHDHLALYMMQTVPERRREGLGTSIAGALAGWGAGRGAGDLFLQVHPANGGAMAFYRHLGFEARYEYWYRQPPPDERAHSLRIR